MMATCVFFKSGNCRYGLTCRNKHDSSEPSATPVHPGSFKTVPCVFFSSGNCRKGEECSFLHPTAGPIRRTGSKPLAANRNPPESRFNYAGAGKPSGFGQNQIAPDSSQSIKGVEFGNWAENNFSKWRIDSSRDNLSEKFRFNVPSPTPDSDCIFYSSDSDLDWDKCDRQLSRLESCTLAILSCTNCNTQFLSSEVVGSSVCIACQLTATEPETDPPTFPTLAPKKSPPTFPAATHPADIPDIITSPSLKDLELGSNSFTRIPTRSKSRRMKKKRSTKRETEGNIFSENKFHSIYNPSGDSTADEEELPETKETRKNLQKPATKKTLLNKESINPMGTQEPKESPKVDKSKDIQETEETMDFKELTEIRETKENLENKPDPDEDTGSKSNFAPKKTRKKNPRIRDPSPDTDLNHVPDGVQGYSRLDEKITPEQPTLKPTANQGAKKPTKKKKKGKKKDRTWLPDREEEEEGEDVKLNLDLESIKESFLLLWDHLPSLVDAIDVLICSMTFGVVFLVNIVASLLEFVWSMGLPMIELTLWFGSCVLRIIWEILRLALFLTLLLTVWSVGKAVSVLYRYGVFQILLRWIYFVFSWVITGYYYSSYIYLRLVNLRPKAGKLPDLQCSPATGAREPLCAEGRRTLTRGLNLVKAGDYSAAESVFTQSVQNLQGKDEFYSARARARFHSLRWRGALEDLAEIKVLSAPDVLLAAQSYLGLGLLDKAEDVLKAYKVFPGADSLNISMSHQWIRHLKEASKGLFNVLEDTTESKAIVMCAKISTAENLLVSSSEIPSSSFLRYVLSDSSVYEEPVNLYAQALMDFSSGGFNAAERGFRACSAQIYKAEKCKALADSCWRFRYTLALAEFALWLNQLDTTRNLISSISADPNCGDFLTDKIELLEAFCLYQSENYVDCLEICREFEARDPGLQSSFRLLTAKVLVAEGNCIGARVVLEELLEDPLVGHKARRLRDSLLAEVQGDPGGDHYQRLGLEKTATDAEIKEAYRRLARENHPDKFPEQLREVQDKIMQDLNASYQVLREPSSRREYDLSMARSEPEQDSNLQKCKEEMEEAARTWWYKRLQKMKKKRDPSREEAFNFAKSYLEQKRTYLARKYQLNDDDITNILEEFR